MCARLAVYDMSAYVHTGMNISKYASETVKGFPVGGIVYFLRSLCLHLGNSNHVVACFDSKCDKKSLLPGYKGNRGAPNNYVIAQLEFLENTLSSIGIPCLKVDGFEADELIYTAVEQHRKDFVRVTTFTSDYDIAHNINFNVDLEPTSTKVNKVSMSNFRDAVIPTHKLMLNTVSAYKAIFGCTSDEVPAFNNSVLTNEAIYQGFCDFLVSTTGGNVPIDYSRDIKTFAAYAHSLIPQIGQDEFKRLVTQAYITYPRLVPDVSFSPVSRNEIDMYKLKRLLCCVRDFPSLRTLRMEYSEITKEESDMFFGLSHSLRTGEFAVKRNLQVSNLPVSSEVLTMRDFD